MLPLKLTRTREPGLSGQEQIEIEICTKGKEYLSEMIVVSS